MPNDSSSLFIKALTCRNHLERPPIWMMRQAGRYLPEYQAIRKECSLEEMFHTPELIATITKQPVERFGVDAAILFADILHVPLSLGWEVTFPQKGGPKCAPLIEKPEHFFFGQRVSVQKSLSFVAEGIEQLKKELGSTPLIGFCGGPFTVLTYLTGKASKRWLYTHPKEVHHLLQQLTNQSIAYLQMQVASGVDAIQIFDTWANLLTRAQFRTFALPYLKQIVEALSLPTLLFSRGASLFASELASLKPSGISFDATESLPQLRKRLPSSIAIQGNLEPELLYSPPAVIRKETEALLGSMAGDPGYIVNLGHGVLPDVPVEHVSAFIETVKRSHATDFSGMPLKKLQSRENRVPPQRNF